MSDGILINTWEDLEPTCLKTMREHPEWKKIVKIPLYSIGPMVRLAGQSGGGRRSELLDWLDKQPSESVLYISFGSGGVLSAEQIIQMVWGLEFSKQRFIWVVQPPSRGGGGGAKENDMSEYLPEGFMVRTHDKGLVVTTWAPQSEILAHSSVGGFLSHCGWNSALESIMNGLPMIAWPLYAEQKMVATLLVEELKVAIRPKVLPTKQVAGREEIEMLVRKIMEQTEGDAMRRTKELKASGEKALGMGGSSIMLSELSRLCKINTKQQCEKVDQRQTSAPAFKCRRPSARHHTAPARLHPSRLQQRPRPLFLPDESAEFQFSGQITQNFKQSRSGRKTGIRRTRRRWKVIGEAVGVDWDRAAPLPVPYGGKRKDVHTRTAPYIYIVFLCYGRPYGFSPFLHHSSAGDAVSSPQRDPRPPPTVFE
ncbi:hypothetical protein ACLB2K_003527 [Fragaria x ananassa]